MMNTETRIYEKAAGCRNPVSLSSPLLWGMIGGLTGTLVMDLVLMSAVWLAGLEPTSCFSMVGVTVRRVLGMPGGEGLTGVAAGVATHYTVGPALGLLFGAIMRSSSAVRGASLKQTLVSAVLYVELISQPMLVTVPIFLQLPLAGTLSWYAGSTVMHAICAVVLAMLVWYGPRGFETPSASGTQAGAGATMDLCGGAWALRKQAVANLLRMGHCAPTSMQTLLDASNVQKEWLVKLSAGMPGGIGNTGHECGAMTSPLVFLGVRHGLHDMDRGLPVIFDKGHVHCRQFLACHQALMCKAIRGNDRFPRHCIRPVCMSPELLQGTMADHHDGAIPAEARASYCRLYAHMAQRHFHCAQAVFERLPPMGPDRQQLLDAVSAFTGGTLFMGLTCSAFTAGVMEVGLQSAEIENSPARVVRLLARMTFGGDAADDNINKFNRPMNAGYRMSKWFASEFGSTQCRAITGCDFSTAEGVQRYADTGRVTTCRLIADRVAQKVQQTLAELGAVQPEYGPSASSAVPAVR